MEGTTYPVGELAAAIGWTLRRAFPEEVWVRGEIRNLNRSRSGHVYFDLVDAEGMLSVTLFASDRVAVNRLLVRSGGAVRMTDGTAVRIRGRLDHHAKRGVTRLRMTWIDPAFTLGDLAARRARIVATLRSEGALERQRTLELSPAPLRVAIVTSLGSAAHADVVRELTDAPRPWVLSFHDTRVQGEDAATTLVEAIGDAVAGEPDVVLLVRGGGSREDLAAFDDLEVARKIAAAPIPVVTGIGHEIDTAVADLVAHHAARTPTAAARFLRDRVAAFEEELAQRARRLANVARRRWDAVERRLGTTTRLVAGAARTRTDLLDRQLAHRADRLTRAARTALGDTEHRLDRADALVRAVDPRRVLARGFSITRTSAGTIVNDPEQVPAGSTIHTELARGTLTSEVR